jgi:ubiquinone/menaquinone biosynthesis C-methylase UbiE
VNLMPVVDPTDARKNRRSSLLAGKQHGCSRRDVRPSPCAANDITRKRKTWAGNDLCFDIYLINQIFMTRNGICGIFGECSGYDCELTNVPPKPERGPMPYDKLQAIREFHGWSQGYDRCILQRLLFEPSHRAIISRISARFGNRPLKVLDVGCGTGVFAARIRAAMPKTNVWGVDLVSSMLTQGAARWQSDSDHVAAVQGDSERLPFAAGTFDVVTCANSFHHYPHQDRAVAEMHRVLKPGGRFFLVDGCRDGLWGWFIYDVCVAGVEGEVHHASAKRFRELMTQAGFQAIAQRVHRGPAPFLITEGVAAESEPAIPAPHFRLRHAAAGDRPPV